MINVHLESHITGAIPEDVFEALSDRSRLQELMPRMQRIEFGDEGMNNQDITMFIGIGGGFGLIRCEGNLTWNEPHELTFTVRNPLPVETHWTLNAAGDGTDLQIVMTLDLVPMLGPMAAFVPKNLVEEMMRKEMTYAIQKIARRVRETAPGERAVAA
jgi:carbon monoxide dehydrogenase subunit G